MSIIIFLIILAVLILVHEFGHFIVAKKSGIKVLEFGLGFPPTLYSKVVNGTKYTLNSIPFGGFVKIFGEDPHMEKIEDVDRGVSFYYKPKWIQASVLSAGVIFNVIFAWILISLGFVIGMPSPASYSSFGQVTDTKLVITEVMAQSPAEKAGLKPGDNIVLAKSGADVLDGDNLTPEKLQDFILNMNHGDIELSYKRGDTETTVSIDPEIVPDTDRRIIGIAMDAMGVLKLPIHLAVLEGARTTWYLLQSTVVGLAGFLWTVVTFNTDFSAVAGPVGIAGIVGEAGELGFVYLLSIVSLISINLAVINLIPFPALDGGRLLFVIIEAITRRPINPTFVQWSNLVGFGFLMILMLIITTNDILKLF